MKCKGLLVMLSAACAVMAQSIVVVSPNGGETYSPGQKVQIQWTVSSQISSVSLYLSLDNGAVWSPIVYGIQANPGTFAWTVPYIKKQSPKALVKISAEYVSNPSSDVSNAAFTVNAAVPDAYEPNDDFASARAISLGDSVVKNALVIGGDSAGFDPSQVDVDFFKIQLEAGKILTVSAFPCYKSGDSVTYGNGNPFIMLYDNAQNLVHSFYYPGAYNVGQGGTYYLKIGDYGQPGPASWCDYGLSINQSDLGSITVVSPNGGETFEPGQAMQIQWTAGAPMTNFLVEYSLDNGARWAQIPYYSYTSQRICPWTVPFMGTQTTQALVRVSASDISNPPTDVSDAPFTIHAAPPDAYEPNNSLTTAFSVSLGDSAVKNAIVMGKDSSAMDPSSNDVDYYKLTLTAGKLLTISPFPCLKNGDSVSYGDGWPNVELFDNAGTNLYYGGSGYYVTKPGSYFVKVSTYAWGAMAAWCKYGLSIHQVTIGSITVVSPNGREAYRPGQQVLIKWKAGKAITYASVEVSLDNGVKWSTVGYGGIDIGGNSYSWIAPYINKKTTKGLVRVIAANITNPPSDVSDGNFSIDAASPDAYEPNNSFSSAYAITPGDSAVKNAIVMGADSATKSASGDVDYFKLRLSAGRLLTISTFPCLKSGDSGYFFGSGELVVELYDNAKNAVYFGPEGYTVPRSETYYVKVSCMGWGIPWSWCKYGLTVKAMKILASQRLVIDMNSFQTAGSSPVTAYATSLDADSTKLQINLILNKKIPGSITTLVLAPEDLAPVSDAETNIAAVSIAGEASVASSMKTADISIPYSVSSLSGTSEKSLAVFRLDDSARAWVPVLSSIDTKKHRIIAHATRFSIYGVFAASNTVGATAPEKRAPVFGIRANYLPNKQSIVVHFSLPQTVNADLKLFDVRGKCVGKKLLSPASPGNFTMVWNLGSLAIGKYFLVTTAGTYCAKEILLIMK